MTEEMYALKPVFNLDARVELPTCMYSLPVIQVSKSLNANGGQCPDSVLKALEARQEAILTKLGHLRDEVSKYRKSLGLATTFSSDTMPQDVKADVVIRCSPSKPAFSLPGIVSMLSNHMTVFTSVHSHSCVPNLPGHLHNFLPNCHVERGEANVKVTLIWKEVGNDCELMVSPISQSVIKGEVNIIRYFARLFPYVFIYENDRTTTAEDNLLDSITSLLWALPKDRQPILRPLAVNLGKAPFLCGESFGIADLALFSALKQLGLERDLQPEFRKWFTLVSAKLMGVKGRRKSRASSSRKSFSNRRPSERRQSERRKSERRPSERKNSEKTPNGKKEKSPRKEVSDKNGGKEKSPKKDIKREGSPKKEVKREASPKKALKTPADKKNDRRSLGKEDKQVRINKDKQVRIEADILKMIERQLEIKSSEAKEQFDSEATKELSSKSSAGKEQPKSKSPAAKDQFASKTTASKSDSKTTTTNEKKSKPAAAMNEQASPDPGKSTPKKNSSEVKHAMTGPIKILKRGEPANLSEMENKSAHSNKDAPKKNHKKKTPKKTEVLTDRQTNNSPGSLFTKQWPEILHLFQSTRFTSLLEQTALVSEKLDGSNIAVSSRNYISSRRSILLSRPSVEELNKFKFSGQKMTNIQKLVPNLQDLESRFKDFFPFLSVECILFGELIQKGTATSKEDKFGYASKGYKAGEMYAFGLAVVFDDSLDAEKMMIAKKHLEKQGYRAMIEVDKQTNIQYLVLLMNQNLRQLLTQAGITNIIEQKPMALEEAVEKYKEKLAKNEIEGIVLVFDDIIYKWKGVEESYPDMFVQQISDLFRVLRFTNPDKLNVIQGFLEVAQAARNASSKKRMENSSQAHLETAFKSAVSKFPRLEEQLAQSKNPRSQILEKYTNDIKDEMKKDTNQDKQFLSKLDAFIKAKLQEYL